MLFLPTLDMFLVLHSKILQNHRLKLHFYVSTFLQINKILLVTLVIRKLIYIELKWIGCSTFHDVQFTGRKVIVKECAERFHMCDNFQLHISLQANTTFDNYFIKKREVCQIAILKPATPKRQFADETFQFLGRFYHIYSFSL